MEAWQPYIVGKRLQAAQSCVQVFTGTVIVLLTETPGHAHAPQIRKKRTDISKTP